VDDFTAEAAKRKKVKDDYRAVFFSDEGKAVLLDLLQYTGVIRPVYCKGDPEQSAFNEGGRAVGLMLLDVLDIRGYKDIMDLERRGIELTKMGEI
jgi:hypothetical protein